MADAKADAIIAAAGSGERLGAGEPKAFVDVAGKPLIAWSLEAFDAAGTIGRIVIAAPPGEEDRAAVIAKEAGVKVTVVPGGDHRSESVQAALEKTRHDLVAVHDAARPLVTDGLIDAIVNRLEATEADCVLAATPVTDTIKEAGRDLTVHRTVPRAGLWAAQTPQAFRAESLRRALGAGDLAAATDDASLAESGGGRVLIWEGPAQNLKVTSDTDLKLAEILLAEREGSGDPGS